MHNKKYLIICTSILLVIAISGCSKDVKGRVTIEQTNSTHPLETFIQTQDNICTDENGKPIIRFFATSWCPHCKWVKNTYIKVVDEYVKNDKIKAYYWEIDKDKVPADELAVFKKYNPEKSVPTFIFGCQYIRIGNGYEDIDDSAAEEAEFRSVINKLIGGKKNE